MTKKLAKIKCPYCAEYFHREDGIKVQKRYYHPECLEKKRQENKENELRDVDESKGESQDYRDLIEYICNKYNTKRPSGMVLKQIKDYKEQYGYTYKGMELALRYFYDTEGNSVKDDTGVGIIIYVYDRAKNFYIRKIEVEDSIQEDEDVVREFNIRGKSFSRGRRQIDIDLL